MGCDIHAFVDYTDKENDHAWNLAEVNISRNYWLFTLMAGVRGNSIQGQLPVSQPKGLPKEVSYKVRNKAYLIVAEDETLGNESGFCTREDAKRWGEKYVDDSKTAIHHPDWHSHSWLSLEEVNEVIKKYSLLEEEDEIYLNPDDPIPDGYTHTEGYSWSGNRIVAQKRQKAAIPVDLLAIQAMMNAVDGSGAKSKLVFFFDN